MPEPTALPNLYTRWTRVSPRKIRADLLLPSVEIAYDEDGGTVVVRIDASTMDPDTARMIGVRLIEAASRAEADRKTRG